MKKAAMPEFIGLVTAPVFLMFFFLNFFFPSLFFLKTLNLLLKNNYIAIHAFQASQAAGAGWMIKFIFPKIPFLLTMQEGKDLNNQNWLTRFFRQLIIHKADAITVISSYLGDYVRRSDCEGIIRIIPNGVDARLYKGMRVGKEAIRKLWGIPNDAKVVITTSRLVSKNNIAGLIKAISLLSENYYLVIIGKGELEDSLKSLVENLEVKSKIIFMGEIAPSKIPTHLKAADVFVRPSFSEGLGNSFLEAMAAGIPVIGSDKGGIRDFLRDGKTGLVCNPDNPNDIAEKITRTLKDGALREKMIQNALDLVSRRYDWQIIAEEYGEVYRKIAT